MQFIPEYVASSLGRLPLASPGCWLHSDLGRLRVDQRSEVSISGVGDARCASQPDAMPGMALVCRGTQYTLWDSQSPQRRDARDSLLCASSPLSALVTFAQRYHYFD